MSKTWKGQLNLGLLSIPVYLTTAAREEHISLNQYHLKCNSPAKRPNYCEACDKIFQAGYTVTSSAQGTSKPVVAWAKEHAIPITTVVPGQGFADLEALKTTIGQARVVALGESVHEFGESVGFGR